MGYSRNVTHNYVMENGEFDYKAYSEDLYEDMLNIAESSILHIWSPDNLDHMRLPTNVDIHTFLARDIRRLFYRWLLLIGLNTNTPSETTPDDQNRNYYRYMSIRDYIVYHVLLQDIGGPSFTDVREALGAVHYTGRQQIIDYLKTAEASYDTATYNQRLAWKSRYQSEYEQYVADNDYAAENILYTPAYPDIIFSSESKGTGVTNDSPHAKIPPVISYKIRKSAPASNDRIPFGPNKDWKFNEAGEFFDKQGENVYRLRMRRWENLVEFTTLWRSGAEAESLCLLFETFMDLNERYFLEAGIEKIVPFGREGEPTVRLDNAGVHYRKTLWYIRTQQFQYYGPVRRITNVDLDVVPTSTSDNNLG